MICAVVLDQVMASTNVSTDDSWLEMESGEEQLLTPTHEP